MDDTSAMIDAAVDRALRGEASLETLISLAVYGRPPDPDEPAWPPAQRSIWEEAVRRWRRRRRGEIVSPTTPRQSQLTITLEFAWTTMVELAPNPEQWWLVPGATWPRLGAVFGIGSRTAHWFLYDVYGWRLRGHGSSRQIIVAPCIVCRTPVPRAQIVDRTCEACREAA